jgi:hypothetical protein
MRREAPRNWDDSRRRVSRGATSPWRMVPKAPWMWPTCALVENGGLDGRGDFNVDRHGSSPLPSPAQERTVRRSVDARTEAASWCRFKEKVPARRDSAGPTERLGPSFKPVSSQGRERSPQSLRDPRCSHGRNAVAPAERRSIVAQRERTAPTLMIGRIGKPEAAEFQMTPQVTDVNPRIE